MVGHTYQTANVQNSPHQNIAPFDHDFMAGHTYQTAEALLMEALRVEALRTEVPRDALHDDLHDTLH